MNDSIKSISGTKEYGLHNKCNASSHQAVATRIKAEIEKHMERDSAKLLDILKEAQSIVINQEILRETKLGILVNKLKHSSNEEVSKLSTTIVNKWKLDIRMSVDNSLKEQSAKISHKKRMAETHTEEDSKKGIPRKEEHSPVSFDEEQKKAMYIRDPTRNKCIKMFIDALNIGAKEKCEKYESEDIDTIREGIVKMSIEMERLLFEERGAVDSEYRSKFRSKYSNLKDSSNPHLREKILMNEISVKRFVEMSIAEMASVERRSTDEAIQRENMLQSRSAVDLTPETDMFVCGRCKERKCKYYQLQTRSADEPMTTYVTCVNCNHRWKT